LFGGHPFDSAAKRQERTDYKNNKNQNYKKKSSTASVKNDNKVNSSSNDDL